MTNDQHPSYHIPATASSGSITVLRPPMQQAYRAACEATQNAWDAYQAAQGRYEAALFDSPRPAPSQTAWRAHLADLAALQAVIDATQLRWQALSKMEHVLFCQVREWMRDQGMWYGGNAR